MVVFCILSKERSDSGFRLIIVHKMLDLTIFQYSVHVTCGLVSVLLWLRCDTLCTSGFMDGRPVDAC